MLARKIFLFLFAIQPLVTVPLAEQFKQKGYVEICGRKQGAQAFDSLYTRFDTFIEFLQKNPAWAQKLYSAKERFIRTKARNYYSTDFFGFYDESKREGRHQIAFYYSTHFHDFISAHYPEFTKVSEIVHFFGACFEIQKAHGNLFNEAAVELRLEAVFHPPILLKVIKYLPSYMAKKPHYDGTAFSLFLDSTDSQSLLFSPYKSSFTVADFSAPPRKFSRDSILLIPGALLTEFSIFPTPHIVLQSGKVRHATIAFAMRANHTPKKTEFSSLPNFTD